MDVLTERQSRFARHVAIDAMPASLAYVAAGYAEKGAEPNSSALIRTHKIVAEIERLHETRDAISNRNADDVLARLWELAGSENEATALGATNTLAKIHKLTTDGIVINVDARQQLAHLSNEDLARIVLGSPSGEAQGLIEGEVVDS